MGVGNANCVRVPIVARKGDKDAVTSAEWDSRECPGPTSEAELSRTTTRRVLTAGALALAVIAPNVAPAPQSTGSESPLPTTMEAIAPRPYFHPVVRIAERSPASVRVSRSAPRRATALRPATRVARVALRKAVRQATAPALRSAVPTLLRKAVLRSEQPQTVRRVAYLPRHSRSAAAGRHRRQSIVLAPTGSTRMGAVLAFARSQVGKSYVRGAEGPNSFDCSGFTKRAYARAGLRLPHSSGAQAARARTISQSRAQAGDLVVGRGHVGIYMGNGMMIDAGNRRVGVVYRRLYPGLHIERF
jgi:cell wall-associated NlpC family hydrolase